jgi:hypothetical protein
MALSSSQRKTLNRSSVNNNALVKKLKRFQKRAAFAGVLDNEQHPTADMSYAQLMDLHENGYMTSPDSAIPNKLVPARPIMRIARKTFDKKWKKDLVRLVTEELAGKRQLDQAYKLFGKIMVEDIRKVFDSSYLEGNTEFTIEWKQSDTPMIATGSLFEKIDSEVTRRKDKY